MKYQKELADRKVLVTGANGFVGSHLVDELVRAGSDVVAFVDSSLKNYENLSESSNKIQIFRGDLRDPVSVRKGVQKLEGYDDVLIFHLGAQAHVGESWERPHETIRTNVIGTLNLLESVRNLDINVSKFGTAGTSEEYGNFVEGRDDSYCMEGNEVVLDEDSPINPKSIYGTSKIAADFLTRNYSDAYGIPSITTRMFNNYGPRQRKDFITSTVINQALNSNKIELGNLKPERDMMYVKDGVRGHIHALIEGEPGEVYNFGSGDAVSMREWAEKILAKGQEMGYWGDVEIVQSQERFRPGESEVKQLKADYSKLNSLSGWKPQISMDEGIRRTIEWYSENKSQRKKNTSIRRWKR